MYSIRALYIYVVKKSDDVFILRVLKIGRRIAMESFRRVDALCVRVTLWEAAHIEASGRTGEYLLLTAPLVLKSQVMLITVFCPRVN